MDEVFLSGLIAGYYSSTGRDKIGSVPGEEVFHTRVGTDRPLHYARVAAVPHVGGDGPSGVAVAHPSKVFHTRVEMNLSKRPDLPELLATLNGAWF
jgi:hypothetical protein